MGISRNSRPSVDTRQMAFYFLNHKIYYCDNCGKEFETFNCWAKRHKRHYCSLECYKSRPLKRKKIKCDTCGIEFDRASSETGRAKNHYCSPTCWYKSKKPKVETKCTNCNEEFETLQSRIEKTQNHFCSQECYFAYRISINLKSKLRFNCDNCGTEILRTPSRAKNLKHHFCNHQCHRLFQKKETKELLDKGLKRCYTCKEIKSISEFHIAKHHWTGVKSSCKPCDNALSRKRYIKNRVSHNESTKRWARKNKERVSDYVINYNAEKRGFFIERVYLKNIWPRDNGICQLCYKPIDKDLSRIHPLGLARDHIIPNKYGGPHCHDNIQLSHVRCNAAKAHKIVLRNQNELNRILQVLPYMPKDNVIFDLINLHFDGHKEYGTYFKNIESIWQRMDWNPEENIGDLDYHLKAGVWKRQALPNCICQYCGKHFHKAPQFLKKHKNHYCSNKCQGLATKRGQIVKCYLCGKGTYKVQSQLKERNFCSRSCSLSYRWSKPILLKNDFIGKIKV